MSSTSTTKANGAKVAASKESKNGTGKSIAKAPTHYELLPQEEATDNGNHAPTAESESSSLPEGTETEKPAAAVKSKPKKAEAAAAKSKHFI